MTGLAGFSLWYLHLYVTEPAEFFMKVIFGTGQLDNLDYKVTVAFTVFVTFAAF